MKSETKTTIEGHILVTVVNRVALPVEAPSRIKIIPCWGEVQSASGDFILDRQAADEIIAAFRQAGLPLPIDAEHTTVGGEFASPSGDAPARGWINSLEAVEGDGLYAEVEWTQQGEQFIRNKEYRYLSPVTFVRKSDRRVIELHSVALTNKPAIVGMPPIVNKETNHPQTARVGEGDGLDEEIDMNAIKKALGLADGADEAACVQAIDKIKADAAKAPTAASVAVCKALGVSETAPEAEIVAAVNKAREVDPAKFVPASEQAKLAERVNTLEAQLSANKAAEFIAGGVKAGKITEATKEMWLGVFKADPAKAEKHLETAPVIAPADGKLVTNASKGAAGGDRQMVINKASSEWRERQGQPEMFAGLNSWVNDALREEGHKPLSKEEAEKLG